MDTMAALCSAGFSAATSPYPTVVTVLVAQYSAMAAYGFTNQADYVDRMVEKVEGGNLSINTLEASLPETPFGVVKSSGYGREGGSEGLHHYMVVKNVSHSITIVD